MGCGRRLVVGRVCAQCQTLLPLAARYCYHCGAYQGEPQAAAPASQPQTAHAAMPAPSVARAPSPPGIAQQQAADSQPAPEGAQVSQPPQPPGAPAERATPAAGVTRPSMTLPPSRPIADLLPSCQIYLPAALYEPLERRPKTRDLTAVRDHLTDLLETVKTYLPQPVVVAPQPPGEPAGGMATGAFLFGDVSGFTPLSEKLKALGQEGAERITTIINGLFSQLVDVLFAHGGTLLKFGGDALLGLFPVDDEDALPEATLRATQAAMAMQEVLQQDAFAAIDAMGETQALKIKCGISAGRYFAAHIGTQPQPGECQPSKMAFVTTGHTVNLAEEAEGHANPGEVAMTQAAYRLIAECEGVMTAPVTKSPDEAYLRLTAAPPLSTAVDYRAAMHEPPDGDLDAQITYLVDRLDYLTPYLSEELITRIASNPRDVRIAPDHRPVTVMFVNYVGVSDLIEDMGDDEPEIIVQQLNAYFNHMAGIVEKYEGLLARMDQYAVGDRLVIFFGAPRAHEDDPIRAIYTALEMQAATKSDFSALQTSKGIYRFRQRIGINTGVLFAGNAGAPDMRQEYTLMGDDINMAARLMSYAEWNQIYVSDKTESYARPYFDFSGRFDLKVKGKSILIPTHKVLGIKETVGRTRGLEGKETTLMGRDQALTALEARAAQWLKGRGQIVIITGQSGLGKSRLIRELKRHVEAGDETDQIKWIEARALSFSEQMNYWLINEAMRSLLDLSLDASADDLLYTLWEKGEALLGKEEARETVPFLAHMLGLKLEGEWAQIVRDLEPKKRQREIFWAARQFFTAATKDTPLAMILDDLHWADEASLALLMDMLSILDRVPIMLILAFRMRRDKGCWDLHNTAVDDYPHRTTKVELSPLNDEQSRAILDDLLPGAVFPEATYREILNKAAGNPLYLEELVRSFIETGVVVREEPEHDEVADLLSTFKRMSNRGEEPDEKTETWIVTEKIHDVTVPNTLRAAIVARIDRLAEYARYALQMAAVIGREFRLEILRNLIEAETEIDLWVSQLERGDLIRPQEVNATLTYTFLDAMVQEVAYDSLLVHRRAEIHNRIGKMLEAAFDHDLKQGCELIAYHYSHGKNIEQALIYLDMAAEKAHDQYANETAIQFYEQMLAFQREQGAQAEQASTLYKMGVLAYEIGDYNRARPWLAASFDLCESLNDQALAGWSMMYMGMVDLKKGDYPGALARHETALKLARDRNDAVQEGIHLTNLARTIKLLGDYDQALALFDQSLVLKEANDDQMGQGFVHYYQGLIHLDQGRYDEAARSLQRVFDIWSKLDKPDRYMSFYHYGMGNVALAQGRCEEALEHLKEALTISERLMLSAEIIEDLSALGQASLCMDDIDAALAYSTRAIKLLESQKDVEEMQRIYLNHYDVLKAAGDDDAGHYFRQARKVMRAQAALIQDEAARAIYLTGVPVNQRINNKT